MGLGHGFLVLWPSGVKDGTGVRPISFCTVSMDHRDSYRSPKAAVRAVPFQTPSGTAVIQCKRVGRLDKAGIGYFRSRNPLALPGIDPQSPLKESE